jgi:hypothetical protein
MRPLFTVHAGEFLVGQHIESSFKGKNVWVPTKDSGVDLLVTNSANTRAVSLQVKFSRDFLPTMKLKPMVLKQLRSCSWFTLDKAHLERSAAHYWVFVLLGFENKSYDYLIIKPKQELQRKLEAIHGVLERYDLDVRVTNEGRAWLARSLKKELRAIDLEIDRVRNAFGEDRLGRPGAVRPSLGKVNHRFLGAAQVERRAPSVHRFPNGFHVGVGVSVKKLQEQAEVNWVAFVGGRCEQQDMIRTIAQEFTQPVSQAFVRLVCGRHAVRLVYNYEVPMNLSQPGKNF